MKYILSCLLLLAVFLGASTEAHDLVSSRALFEDISGKLTISEVAHREFKPMGPTLFKGFSSTVYWLRVTVRAPDKGSDVVLLIRQPFLNEIRLYEADAGRPEQWKARVTGNHYPYAARERSASTLSFIVSPSTREASYYLRLQTSSPVQLTLEALTPAQADQRDSHFDVLEVFFATSMLALMLWALHSYVLDRQAAVGWFALHQLVYTCYGSAITGYLAPLIPAGFPRLADCLIIIPYCAVNLTTVLFCRALFKPYRPPALMMSGLTLLVLAFPLQLLAIALGYPSVASISNYVLIRVTWWYLVVMTFTLRQEQLPSRRVLQVFFSAITLILTALWLSYHSSPGDTKSYLYGREVLIANGLIIGALFAMILSAHSRRLLREVQQSSSSLFLAQKTLEIERELKEQAQAQARTDFLTGLFNRRHFVTLAERELMRSTRYQRPLTMMMIDIDHFKLVNDTWGHQTGDLVLQKVSRVIREMLRSLDICGRTGGEEFAAALIETDEIGAMAVAQRLCQAVAAAVIIPEGGGCVQVTISVGLAELQGRAIDFDSLMNEADHALYRAKQAGRNCVLGRGFPS